MRTIDDIFASESLDESNDLLDMFNQDEVGEGAETETKKDDDEEGDECGKCCQDLAFESADDFDEMAFLADADDDIEDDAKSGAKADTSDLDKGDKDDKKDDDKDDKDDKDDDKKDDDKDDKKDDDKDDDKGEECGLKFEESVLDSIDDDFLGSEEYFDVFNDSLDTNVNDPEDDIENEDESKDEDEDEDEDKDDDKDDKDEKPAKDETVGLGDDDDLTSDALFDFMDGDLL